jgi:signal transduction histidine kinase/CheY-like chemotaxis protein
MATPRGSVFGRALARVGMSGLFSLATSGTIVAFALVSSAAVSWLSIRDARENLMTQGALFTERFAGQATLALLYGSPENAREPVRQALGFPQVRAVGIYDAQGQPLLESAPLGALELAGWQPANRAIIERENAAEWVFLAPVYAGGSDQETAPFAPAVAPELLGYVRLAESKSSLAAITRRVVWSNLAISAAIAAVLGLLSHLLARRITGPIRALAAAMHRAQEGDTGARAAENGPLELRTMETAFNRMMDVLEQRQTDLRSARDQAMEAARVKAQFAAHVSHELRTPLNGLLGMLQLLESGGSEDQRRSYLRTALSSGRSLLAVINDILDFSRGEAGKIEIEARTFALKARITEIIDLLHPIAQAKGITLECRFEPEVPDGVVGDPTRIAQVLTNLIGNAIRFTSRGGVTVHVAHASTPQERSAIAQLRFEVADTGIGIAPEAQAHIFESFTQASAATGREYGGSGLGLTIARQLVELMGGTIGLTSTPGLGSTFWFTLALPVAGHAAPTPPLDGVRVLAGVAADDTDQRELVARLERLGAAVTTHPSGAQVLLAAARASADGPFSAVLIAPQLSEMRGAELAGYLARLPQRARPRVHALTNGETADPPPLGCEGWLPVTATERELIAALAEPAAPERVADSRRPRVLVAEDDTASQMVARGLLETAGCDVVCVGDGRAVLEALARERFELVFLDLNMPVLSGLATAQALRERGGELPPLIAMTANTLPEDVARARAAGMDDFVATPV